ncbi:hypothetical protein AB1286_06270 [Trinickia sp. NRRL B-1857]|uniref:hypothetical protein n=1 Tax=Trinickia sp. NRRL B-1857 TaxID=3162879 RepID=UPI003D2E4805
MSNKPQSRSRLACFLLGTALLCILATAAAYKVGFAAMAAQANLNPERLRDYTFPVWQAHSPLQHGFLTFLTANGFAEKAAYANHATVYLWFMDALYHVQRIIPAATMRLTGASLAILATLLAAAFVVQQRLDARLSLSKLIVLALGFFYVATLPTYWIAVGRFNVDNGFIFVMPLLVMLSHYAANGEWRRRGFWFWAIALTLVMPMASALFACGMIVRIVAEGRLRARDAAAPVLLGVLAGLVYLEPVLVAKWLGFASENSTWAFRAGLDGDTTYFSNAANSLLSPYFRRPAYLVLVPVLIVLGQWLSRPRRATGASPDREAGNDWWFVAHMFSFYALTLLFWPQAVSIHPYLYDAVLVGPIATWIMITFARRPLGAYGFTVWSFCLAILIMFNLTSIAQAARCTQCAYPHWGLAGDRIG